MDEITFGEVRRNKNQVIRVKLLEYDGRPWVTLEAWAKGTGDDAPATFTGKKFTLSAHTWSELCPLIEAAASEGVQRYRSARTGGSRR